MVAAHQNSAASDAINYQLLTISFLKWLDTQDQKPR
jgi:hypothetical protein